MSRIHEALKKAEEQKPPAWRPTDPTPLNYVGERDRKSTRLNSSHDQISYAVFCLKKKKNEHYDESTRRPLRQSDVPGLPRHPDRHPRTDLLASPPHHPGRDQGPPVGTPPVGSALR